MSNKFASGKKAIGVCDRCGFQYAYRELKGETVKLQPVNNRVCPRCFDPDHPQLQVGMYPVEDPQALRDARPDTSYVTSGQNNAGNLSDGSRIFEWGWYPVGGASSITSAITPNSLASVTAVGTVTVTTT